MLLSTTPANPDILRNTFIDVFDQADVHRLISPIFRIGNAERLGIVEVNEEGILAVNNWCLADAWVRLGDNGRWFCQASDRQQADTRAFTADSANRRSKRNNVITPNNQRNLPALV
jgi:hypothetical protein